MRLPRFHHVGRRGAYLFSKGTLYVLYGVGLAVASVHQVAPGYYSVLRRIAPLGAWGLVWALVGLVAIVSAVVPVAAHLRHAAFAGLMSMATLWAVGILLVYLFPGFSVSGAHPWIVSALFASLMASTAVVAGWPESERR